MSSTWRFLDLGRLSALDANAIPEGLLAGVAGGEPDTLAIYVPSKPFVSVGREEQVRQAVDLDYCAAHDIPVVRRTTHGDALYADPGQICYTVAHRLDGSTQGDGTALIEGWLEPLIEACREFDVEARFHPYSHLYRGRYEIGGAHALIRDGVLLLTAYLSVNVSESTAKAALGIADGDPRNHPHTSLRHEYEGHAPPDTLEIRSALGRAFRKVKEITFEEGSLTTPEMLAATEARKRFESQEWTFAADEAAAEVAATPEGKGIRVWHNQRCNEGCALDLTLVTEGGHTIRDIAITGTSLFLQEDGMQQVLGCLRDCYLNPPTIGERILDLYDLQQLVSPGTNAADFLILIGDTIDKMAPGGH